MNKWFVCRYGWSLAKSKILSARTYSLLIVYICFLGILLSPVRNYVKDVKYPIAPWIFPCLMTNLVFQLLIAFCSIYFFSDVPFFQYKEMYQMIRCGRLKWTIAHTISIVESSFLFSMIISIIPVLLLFPYIDGTFKWGKVINTVALTNINEYYHIPFTISYAMVNKFTPIGALIISVFLVTLLLSLMGEFMFFISILSNKVFAVLGATAVVAWSVIVYNMGFYQMEKLSYYAPVLWLDISRIDISVYGMYVLPGYKFIFITSLFLLAVMASLIAFRLKKQDIGWLNED